MTAAGRDLPTVLLTICIAACHPATESAPMADSSQTASPASPTGMRRAPAFVAPVVIDGIAYAQMIGSEDEDVGQHGGLLAAYAADGTRLWWMKVYDNRRIAGLEGDVQDVFFTSMRRDAEDRLVIENEAGDRFLVDVHARRATALPRLAPTPQRDDGIYPDD